jgi:hypothetical protein
VLRSGAIEDSPPTENARVPVSGAFLEPLIEKRDQLHRRPIGFDLKPLW